MGIEVATFVSDLQAANPGSSDLRSQGDDHLRLLKAVLQATFPTASKAFYNPTTSAKSANFTVVAADMHKTFIVDTSGGAVNMTLPTLGAGDAGWECYHIKTTQGVNPVFVVPASGTVTSGALAGLAKARRSVPGSKIKSFWTGTAWFISRAEGLGGPVGVMLDFSGSSLPFGFEWPSGQTLASASTNYPEFFTLYSSGFTFDMRGRVSIALDNLGGSAAGRLGGGTITGTAVGNVGGSDVVTLTTANLASHQHTGTTIGMNTNQNHTHGVNQISYWTTNSGSGVGGGGSFGVAGTTNISIQNANIDHSHAFTSDAAGSGTAHSNLQPSIMVSKILVVE